MEYNMINIFNLVIVAVMLVPSIVYSFKYNLFVNRCQNTAMNICEWLGRAACIAFMVIPFGVGEFGFSDVRSFLIYAIVNMLLLALYLLFWKTYIKKQNAFKALVLAVIPTAIFAICGVTLRHYILIASTVMFGVGHLYVTMANNDADVKKVKRDNAIAKEKAEAEAKAAQQTKAEAEAQAAALDETENTEETETASETENAIAEISTAEQ